MTLDVVVAPCERGCQRMTFVAQTPVGVAVTTDATATPAKIWFMRQ